MIVRKADRESDIIAAAAIYEEIHDEEEAGRITTSGERISRSALTYG